MEFDSGQLVDPLTRMMAAGIRYEMNGMIGKARPLSKEPEEVRQLDCSGFFEYVLYRTTRQHLNLPAGSRRQRSWLQNEGYRDIEYSAGAPMIDNIVRVGFRDGARDADGNRTKVGHVWLVINGNTYEASSRRSVGGVGSIRWSERTDHADHCFELGAAPLFGLGMMIHRGLQRLSATAAA